MSQIVLDSLKKQGYTPYPNKFVTAEVVKIGHTASFTGAGGVQGEILNFVLADSNTAMLATMNDPTKFKLLKEGKTFIIRNCCKRMQSCVHGENENIANKGNRAI